MSVDADDYEGQTILIIGRGKFVASLLLFPNGTRYLRMDQVKFLEDIL